MSTYILTFPIVVLRSIMVVTDDVANAVKNVTKSSARSTDETMRTDQTHGYFVDPSEGFTVSVSEVGVSNAPTGTVMQ